MPIRLKLTLWYTSLLAIVLVVFSSLLFFVLEYALHAQIDRGLEDRAQQVGQAISQQRVMISPDGDIIVPRLETLVNIFTSPAVFVQIINSDGQVILTTRNSGFPSFGQNDNLLARNLSGQSAYSTIQLDDTPLRLYSSPLLVQDQVVGAVQVGQSIEFIDETLNVVGLFLLSAIMFGLVMSFMMGAFLSWRALRPIEKINRAAMKIVGAQDLKQRLPESRANDELRRLTSTINGMLERLDNFFQAQVRLSADISHELRTPLTAIRGNIDLLRRGAASDPKELKEALTIIDSELDRMSRIVADLLLLSQADAGLSLRINKVELDTVVLEVYRQARVFANGVQLVLGHEDQAVVCGDADRLQQLLINLVTNAIKHTPYNGTVTLSLFRDESWVRVEVKDTGRGIAPKALPHIFERFYRGENNDQKGMGVGLSIAQWIAKAHEGKISVESEVGVGSTFTLWLPLKKSPAADTLPSSVHHLPASTPLRRPAL